MMLSFNRDSTYGIVFVDDTSKIYVVPIKRKCYSDALTIVPIINKRLFSRLWINHS